MESRKRNKTKSKMMRNIIIGASTLVIFLTGSLVGVKADQSNWLDQLSKDSANAIDTAAKTKANDLTVNVQTEIQNAVKSKITPILDAKKADIQAQLQAYFDSKTTDITNSAGYKASVADLDRIETNLLAGYKAQIDQAFAGQ